MLSSLLTQFRQRYPQGSLTSDLVTIHDGQYVVRVCAGAEGMTLACGLAANPTLEQAEDLATTRALERLGQGWSAARAIAPGAATQPALSLVVPEPVADLATPALSPLIPEPTQLEPGLDHNPSPTILEPTPVALAIPPDIKAISPSSELRSLAVNNQVDEFMALGTGPVTPIDLSDIIAQTDVELQRLGWGVTQGREFLEKTYGKRSRHDLTDDELLEFLLYLETQSPLGSA